MATYTFRVHGQRIILMTFAALAVLVMTPNLRQPSTQAGVLSIISLTLCLGAIGRQVRCATIHADESGVTVTSFLWTRSLAWPDISEFRVEKRTIGAGGYYRMVLIVALLNGSTVVNTELNTSPRDPERALQAASILNKMKQQIDSGRPRHEIYSHPTDTSPIA